MPILASKLVIGDRRVLPPWVITEPLRRYPAANMASEVNADLRVHRAVDSRPIPFRCWLYAWSGKVSIPTLSVGPCLNQGPCVSHVVQSRSERRLNELVTKCIANLLFHL